MVKGIWQQKGMPDGINEDVTRAFIDKLWNGVGEGYNVDVSGIDYDTTDGEMIASLQRDVYHFSAAKNYQQLKSLSQALVGDDGKLRSWQAFKEAAYAINDQHVNVWLRTEYDTAVASAQMASKWVTITSDRSAFPNLEFDAVMDGRTSPICTSLNGVIKPVDDPFWSTYYPPNHFNCRSTVRQRSDGRTTPDDKIEHPENVPAMFKTNLAKSGLAFPPTHPYYEGLPREVKEQADALLEADKKEEQP